MKLSKDERSLLLFLEDCAVNSSGRVNMNALNDADVELTNKWREEGFIDFGRIAFNDITKRGITHWCVLSDQAWELVSQERKARAGRLWSKRRWRTAQEYTAE